LVLAAAALLKSTTIRFSPMNLPCMPSNAARADALSAKSTNAMCLSGLM
jgi:hypothetical protein